MNIFADHAGGLWVLGPRDIVRLKGTAVSSHFQLEGGMFQSVSEAPDGSLWVVDPNSDAPLCHVTDSLKCYGKEDGIPISGIQSVLSDGNGGFWLGGRRAEVLVHWHAGTSQKYKVGGEVFSLARGSDGTLWVGLSAEGPGSSASTIEGRCRKAICGPPFNGSGFDIGTLMFDHDGNLWVGTKAKGAFFESTEMRWSTTTVQTACPAIPCTLFLKTERGSSGPELQAELTAFVIPQSSRSRRWKDWGRIYQRASWPAEMGRCG